MLRTIFAALVLCLGLTAPAHAIVGGNDAAPGEYPFIAHITIDRAFSCTGTLVDADHVVTASHCSSLVPGGIANVPIGQPGQLIELTIGAHETPTSYLDAGYNGESGGEEHVAKSVAVNPAWAGLGSVSGDVSVITLDRPSAKTPVKIANAAERSLWAAGTMATIAGFGVTEFEGDDSPDVLQEAQVPIVADAVAAEAYPYLVDGVDPLFGGFENRTQVGAGFPQGGVDTCQGDSGGPLLVPAGSELRLVGDTSYGYECAEPGLPGDLRPRGRHDPARVDPLDRARRHLVRHHDDDHDDHGADEGQGRQEADRHVGHLGRPRLQVGPRFLPGRQSRRAGRPKRSNVPSRRFSSAGSSTQRWYFSRSSGSIARLANATTSPILSPRKVRTFSANGRCVARLVVPGVEGRSPAGRWPWCAASSTSTSRRAGRGAGTRPTGRAARTSSPAAASRSPRPRRAWSRRRRRRCAPTRRRRRRRSCAAPRRRAARSVSCWLCSGSLSSTAARARCSALLTDATVVSSVSATSSAEKPSTSRRMSTARWLGGRCWSATMNASSTLSRIS